MWGQSKVLVQGGGARVLRKGGELKLLPAEAGVARTCGWTGGRLVGNDVV